MKTTKQEDDAIRSLQAVARIWPKSLWLFSASGSLHVMRKSEGKRAMEGGVRIKNGYDTSAVVTAIEIENDGGDW